MGMVRTGKTVICVLLRLQDVEEGVKKAIVFLCLQARVGSARDAYRGALIDPGATKGGSGSDRWRYAMPWASKVSRRGSWGGECVWRSGRRTCLSCNSALLRMSASASRVAIMQLRMAEASILRSRCGPVHTEGSGLFASRQEREGRQCELMRVSSVCSADCGLRCGAVGEQQPLIEDAPNKNLWRAEKAGRCRQGHSGAAETNCSTDPGVYRSATVTAAPSRLSVRRGVLFRASASALPCIIWGIALWFSKLVSKPQTKYSVIDIGLAARLASTGITS